MIELQFSILHLFSFQTLKSDVQRGSACVVREMKMSDFIQEEALGVTVLRKRLPGS